MHHYRVTVQLTYTTDVYMPTQDLTHARDAAIDLADPDSAAPVILDCPSVGNVADEP
jgi:hypothetical protein